MDVPLPPLLPGLFPTSNNMIRGSGILSWLSPKAGLINCSKPMHATVSFQIKDFCDSGVTDLTQYLRVGFRLAFHAIPNNTSEWIANYVSPINEQDFTNGVVNDGQELNLESFEQNNMPPGKAGKDTYLLEKEMRALAFLLSIFQKNTVHYIPLSNLHSRISNSGDQELSRYIGSSSLKRRQFIEDRSYIFQLAENDVVYLQMPEIYHTVMQLAGFLLTHGGVTSSDLLFTFFNKCTAIPTQIKESIQNPPKAGRQQFMQFLSRHPFAFAPFPSQYYVGVRRNLPFFDYATFVRRVRENQEKKMPLSSNGLFPHPQSFPNFQSSRPVSRPLLQSGAESFESQLSPVDGPIGGGGGLAAALSGGGNGLSSGNPLAAAVAAGHGLGGALANGFASAGTMNGHSSGGHHGGLGNGGGINGIGGVGGNGTSGSLSQSSFMQQQTHAGGAAGQQKPLFSLFDDPIVPNQSAASTQSAALQNGVRSLVGGGSGPAGPLTNGTSGIGGVGPSGTTNNIWKYDMDFFDGSKISDVFSANFNSMLSMGETRASPPRKQFVEREVQTDESSFGTNTGDGESVCAKCANKICNNK